MKELEICRICNQPVTKLNHFYHQHSLTLEEYCTQQFNRRDILTNEPIVFKSPEQYFGSDFLNKNNLKKYLKNLPRDQAVSYCQNLLIKRKDEKQLIYSPLQVELRSLPCFPAVSYLDSIFDYHDFCHNIGLINRTKKIPADFGLEFINFHSDSYITIDSRESNPLKFDFPIEISKLNVGDYAFSGNPGLVFERKSIADMIGTLSGGFDRFVKELERAEASGVYLVMIVENKFSEVMSFNHLPWMKRVKTKATPEFIFHQLRDLLQRFPRFQVLFVDGRKQVVEYIMKGFLSGDTFKEIDLQLAWDLDLI